MGLAPIFGDSPPSRNRAVSSEVPDLLRVMYQRAQPKLLACWLAGRLV